MHVCYTLRASSQFQTDFTYMRKALDITSNAILPFLKAKMKPVL